MVEDKLQEHGVTMPRGTSPIPTDSHSILEVSVRACDWVTFVVLQQELSLVPRPRLAFHHLQYGKRWKAGRG